MNMATANVKAPATPAPAAPSSTKPKAEKPKRDPTLPKVSGFYPDLAAAQKDQGGVKNFADMRPFKVTNGGKVSFILAVSRSAARKAAFANVDIKVDSAVGKVRAGLMDQIDHMTPEQLNALRLKLASKGA